MPRHSEGLTLTELLLALAIACTIMLTAGAPAGQWLGRSQTTAALTHYLGLLQFARTSAVLHGGRVSLCAVDAGEVCTNDWGSASALMVFEDPNGNGRREASEAILRKQENPSPQSRVRWRASLARRHLTFGVLGNTWQNGSLYYCPENGDVRLARTLTVNHGGRPYLSADSDGDGIHEDRRGHPLDCSW